MENHTTAARADQSAITTNLVDDPMDAISDVICEQERVLAAFDLVTQSLHDVTEQQAIAFRDVYDLWLVLRVVVDSQRGISAKFNAIEDTLLKRLPFEVREGMVVKAEG